LAAHDDDEVGAGDADVDVVEELELVVVDLAESAETDTGVMDPAELDQDAEGGAV
jgi:hypothetical protein